jgi:hypothetical protein
MDTNTKIATVTSMLDLINAATPGLVEIIGAVRRPDGSLEALPEAKKDFQAAVDGAAEWNKAHGF